MENKARSHYLPFYFNDYLGDTTHLTMAEHGAYLLMIVAYWKNGGPMPADEVLFAKMVRASPKEWQAVRLTLLQFFKVMDGAWVHNRIDRELAAYAEKIRTIKVRATSGGLASAASRAKRAAHVELGLNPGSTQVQPGPKHSDSDSDSDGQNMEALGYSTAPGQESAGTPPTGSNFRNLGNHPPLATIIKTFAKMAPEFSVQDITDAWNTFEATAVDGIWYFGNRPATNWLACFSSRLVREASFKNRKTAGGAKGIGGSISTETNKTETLIPA